MASSRMWAVPLPMRYRFLQAGPTGHQSLWAVLLLLLVVVLVPTAGVLWFMTTAVRNERLAVRQTLSEVFRLQLSETQRELNAFWEQKLTALQEAANETEGGATFARVVLGGHADSVICFDAAGGAAYPSVPEPPTQSHEAVPRAWAEAERMEYVTGDPATAATVYSRIAGEATDPNLGARALRAQARALVLARRSEAAIGVLAEKLQEERYRHAVGSDGRLIAPNARLRALQLMGDRGHPAFARNAEALRTRLADYQDVALSASQRLFLMRELGSVAPEIPEFPTLSAEDLAARYLESGRPPARDSSLRTSGVPGVWQLASRDGTFLALFHQDRLLAGMREVIATRALPAGAIIDVQVPGSESSEPLFFASIPAGLHLPGWRLALRLEDSTLFDSAADEQIAAYLWTGTLVIATLVILSALFARYWVRQMGLARLKSDLVATVSHELKTPLSSTRLFVDTLLDGQYQDKQVTREYLQLIAKENTRLSHLIDNFLNFSRMDRNKRSFELAEVNPSDIASSALDAVRERFKAASFQVDTEIAADLPAIIADSGALVTVLLNLLDNAYTYSENEKHVILRAYASDGRICLEVEDHGIGLSRRETSRIFGRFYQVDQNLSRRGGGVGLGLNIAKFIVAAHGGSITVTSQPGKGSIFTVWLPPAGSEAAKKLKGVSA